MPKVKQQVSSRQKNLAKARKVVEGSRKEKVKARDASQPLASTSTSSKTRKSLVKLDPKEKHQEKERIRLLIYEDTVEEIVKNMLCSECASDKVAVKFTHHQIDTYVRVACECGYVIVDTLKTKVVKKKGFHPLTLLLVYAMMLLGVGYDGANKIMSFWNLKHFTKTTYIHYAKYVTANAVNFAKSILEKSREAVFTFYESKGVKPVDGMLNTSVSYDGSWHKRGHKSNFGTGAAIDVETGLIVDYTVFSKICFLCNTKLRALMNKKITETEYVFWLADHLVDCDQNFEDDRASGGMEPAAAVVIWGRSEAHHMRYTTFVSDGDSAAFLQVKQMCGGKGPYGAGVTIEKADCVNHVAKRLGTNLRNLKKTKKTEKKGRSSMGGRDKLTDNVINHLQYYFQVSLNRKIKTSASEMREEILSTFYHCISTDDNPQHDRCTKGPKSWCFYNRSIACDEEPPSHDSMIIYFHLEPQELAHVKAVYDRLTSNEMMKRCLQGLTQNRNEHLHSRIWKFAPKHRNASRNIVEFAAATAVCNYNVGYAASNLAAILGIESTVAMERYFKDKDVVMDSPYRRKMRNKKLQKDLEYAAGAF